MLMLPSNAIENFTHVSTYIAANVKDAIRAMLIVLPR